MFLGRYDFDGDPPALVQAYDRMMVHIPPDNVHFHVCVEREGGLSVYDGCPTEAVFMAFSSDPGTQALFEAAGLPRPRVTPLGEVHRAMSSPEYLIAYG